MVLVAEAVASGFMPGASFLRSHTEAVLSPLLLTSTCSSEGSSCNQQTQLILRAGHAVAIQHNLQKA